jgi:hypothetical protein
MPMSYADAERFYEGRIPPGAVDDTLLSRFQVANGVRVVNIRPKPATIIERMARRIEMLMAGGTVTQGQLKLLGFSDAEIATYAPDALRLAHVRNPTFETVEMGA